MNLNVAQIIEYVIHNTILYNKEKKGEKEKMNVNLAKIIGYIIKI